MAVTHPKVSTKPDGVDTTKVLPSDWNAAHTNGDLGLSLGLTGATIATRYVGGTTSAVPSTGTFVAGDFVITQSGKVKICTLAGSPGTWVDADVAGSSQAIFISDPSGNLTVRTGTRRWYNDTGRTLTFVKARVHLLTAPTGSSAIFDVSKDGTTIWTTQTNRLTVAVAGTSATQTTFNVATIADGSYLTVDIDQIGSTIPGADATVTVTMAG